MFQLNLQRVALRKESVDRNNDTPDKKKINPAVALRKESVDRNLLMYFIMYLLTASLSARRAWIEIPITSPTTNCFKSLSARRAWIEIDFNGS